MSAAWARSAATLILLALFGLAGCSSDDQDDHTGSTAAGEPESAYPVSIESALGTADIETEPERIVTIGRGTADIVVALGHTPVGIEEDTWSGDEQGYNPWFREAIDAAGGELPATFTAQPEIDMDAIVELDPDVILAPQSGITQDDFDLLNDLAPTVAYPEEAWGTPWDTTIELVGEALGQSDEAAALIDEIDAQFAEVAAEHPEFDGVTFAYIYASEPGALGVMQPYEPRATFVSKLGLTPAPFIEDLPISEGTASSEIGLENADMLDDTDVVINWFSDAEQQAEIEAQPLYAQIPAVERGSYVVNYDRPFVTATSLLTPLTVPWVIDDYADQLAEAVAQL
ncbi:iron-siderophore ABC transporter substrate-binding protein [Phytoactinopolyspora halophila]|uniref:iron-siderophore ABC transporter substrate-binding protein n=1 Tax=Phytoactinopolyspora halophila TaxID=1981511 RepID=UPI001B8CB5FC|nr:iron-siderophore ABC transporter substrate-binding protein [Phytoactinopolyspora halophila]